MEVGRCVRVRGEWGGREGGGGGGRVREGLGFEKEGSDIRSGLWLELVAGRTGSCMDQYPHESSSHYPHPSPPPPSHTLTPSYSTNHP